MYFTPSLEVIIAKNNSIGWSTPIDLGTPCIPYTPITKKYNNPYTNDEANIVKIIDKLV